MLSQTVLRFSAKPTCQVSRTFATTAKKDKFTVGKNGQINVEFGTNPFQTYKIDAPAPKTTTTKEELIKFYRDMTEMRRTEVVADNLYKQKLIRGFLHLYNGQEAIVSGYEAAITHEDHVITAYRDHAHFLGRGGKPVQVFAELLGKQSGCSGGKGGSMHMYKADTHFHGGNGIVGAQVPVGAGVAFALKYLNTGRVSLAFYGDGAANQGQIFEAYNMAALWKLPCIFICENNKYGMGTSVQRASANTDYYTRGDYIPGLKIDAMNVLAVKEGMKFSAEYARTQGPIIVEMETYRYMGHSMSDPGLSYRTRDEVSEIRAQRDPIDRVKLWLLENEFATEEQLKEIEKQIRKEVDEAAKAAQEAPFPEPRELFTNIYTDKPYYVRHVELQNSVVID
jgi:pyruvate dehydrogenase E1 component alpha subunit